MGLPGVEKLNRPCDILFHLSRASHLPYRRNKSQAISWYFNIFPYFLLRGHQGVLPLRSLDEAVRLWRYKHGPGGHLSNFMSSLWRGEKGKSMHFGLFVSVLAPTRIPSWVYLWNKEFTEIPTMGAKIESKYDKTRRKVLKCLPL